MQVWLVKDAKGPYVYARYRRGEDAVQRVAESNAYSESHNKPGRVEAVEGELPDVPPHTITLNEVQQLFRDIEGGAVTVTPEEEPDEVYAGNVPYRTSSGWQIVVFNDCASFDYIDNVTAPDGRHCEAWHQELVWNEGDEYEYVPADAVAEWLKSYGPPESQEQTVWRINLPSPTSAPSELAPSR